MRYKSLAEMYGKRNTDNKDLEPNKYVLITTHNSLTDDSVTLTETDSNVIALVNRAKLNNSIAVNFINNKGKSTHAVFVDNINDDVQRSIFDLTIYLQAKAESEQIDSNELFSVCGWENINGFTFNECLEYYKQTGKIKKPYVLPTLTRTEIEEMIKDDIIALIQEIELNMNVDIVVSGYLKADYINALCGFLGV